MCVFIYPTMKEQLFDKIVKDATKNIEAWNKKVKKKEYLLYESDSDSIKEVKIYINIFTDT